MFFDLQPLWSACRGRRESALGFTVIELLIVIAILGLLSSIVITTTIEALAKAKRTRGLADMRTIEKAVATYQLDHDELPDSLDQINLEPSLDPWGRPWEYLRIDGGSAPRGKWRKDRFLVPINSDYDLYSRGPDGQSRPPLTARASRDDIIRAGNGAYLGPASDY